MTRSFDERNDELYEPVPDHVEAALVSSSEPYPPPLDQLLHLGSRHERQAIPEQIAQLGLTQEHVPDLVRMMRDRELNTIIDDRDEGWAPIHALLALEQFDTRDYVADLIRLFDIDSDWFSEQIPSILARAGEVALEPLRAYLNDRTRWVYGRGAAGTALERLAEQHPELRDQVIQILAGELEYAAENAPELNGFLLSNLISLRAVEALPSIRRAFEGDYVDETIIGDWAEVLQELGQPIDPEDELVRRSRERWRRSRAALFGADRPALQASAAPSRGHKESAGSKRKRKRKMESASRKANRKKKRK